MSTDSVVNLPDDVINHIRLCWAKELGMLDVLTYGICVNNKVTEDQIITIYDEENKKFDEWCRMNTHHKLRTDTTQF